MSEEGLGMLPPSAEDLTEMLSHGKLPPTLSARRHLEAAGEWLQDNGIGAQSRRVCLDTQGNLTRYDWRVRAPSRVRTKESSTGKPGQYVKRIRAPNPHEGDGGAYYGAIENYSAKFKKLIDLEEAEDEALLKSRLANWSLAKLRREGYCLTGMQAYWLQANQFGGPVARFSLGPGVELPDHKFERGVQVLVSRLDPLKEVPWRGSLLLRKDTHLHVGFPEQFDLNEGEWRLDLGRPNLVYDRMRAAVSSLKYDPQQQEEANVEISEEYILQGTCLRDVILQSYHDDGSLHRHPPLQAPDDISYPAQRSLDHGSLDKAPFEEMGAFKDDMRIVSWVKRYSKPNPLMMDGDPPLDNLNRSQMRAIAAMIGQRISLIQGPPGTGKTKTILEAVKLLKLHFEVPHPLLVCTFTNVAVDNLVEGLAKAGLNPLRVGFGKNVRQSLSQYSLDNRLGEHPLHATLLRIIEDESNLSEELDALRKKHVDLLKKLNEQDKPKKSMLQRALNMKHSIAAMELRHKAIKARIYAIQQQMLRDVVADADVICTTCITAACTALNVIDFPVVFLDEASMSTEPASLIPLMKGSQHVALIGDHKQLPPVIVSQQAQADGLAISLFERLTEEAVVPSVMLDVQYRMHPSISLFPSAEFYDLSLLNGTVDDGGNVIPGLDPPNSKHLKRHGETGKMPSVVFLDHVGCESPQGRSYVNETEAYLVASIVEDLLVNNEHLQGHQIGIIAPYVGQIRLLTRLVNTDQKIKQRLRDVLGNKRAMETDQIEIKTVDGFEGREKEVIIFSTVRNNTRGHIGFLADRRRLNVGLTRAKRGLFVLGNIQTLQTGKLWNRNGREHAVVRVGKGAESWRRYTEFLTHEGLVVSLAGHELRRAVNGRFGTQTQAQKLMR